MATAAAEIGSLRSAAGAERILDAPFGRAAFLEVLDRLLDHGPRDQEPRVVGGPQGLHLGDRHRAFVAGAGSVGPAPLRRSAPGWSA